MMAGEEMEIDKPLNGVLEQIAHRWANRWQPHCLQGLGGPSWRYGQFALQAHL